MMHVPKLNLGIYEVGPWQASCTCTCYLASKNPKWGVFINNSFSGLKEMIWKWQELVKVENATFTTCEWLDVWSVRDLSFWLPHGSLLSLTKCCCHLVWNAMDAESVKGPYIINWDIKIQTVEIYLLEQLKATVKKTCTCMTGHFWLCHMTTARCH